MRKFISFLVLSVLLIACLSAAETELKAGNAVTIDDYAIITVTEAKIADHMNSYKEDATAMSYSWSENVKYNSGADAEYYALIVDIINLQLVPVDFLEDIKVTATFNDKYSFQGFAEQFNWDNTYDNIMDGGLGGGSKLISHYSFIAEPDRFDILPLYTGHYVFGAKLPNAVLKMDGDLVFHITHGEHTLTFTVND